MVKWKNGQCTGQNAQQQLYQHLLRRHHRTSTFHAATAWTVWLSTGKLGACIRLQSDLARFQQLDTLPNANHSNCVEGLFYVTLTWELVGQHIEIVLFMFHKLRSSQGALALTTFGWCRLQATDTGASQQGTGTDHIWMVIFIYMLGS